MRHISMRLNVALLAVCASYVRVAFDGAAAHLANLFRLAMQMCRAPAMAVPRCIRFAQHFQQRRAYGRAVLGGRGFTPFARAALVFALALVVMVCTFAWSPGAAAAGGALHAMNIGTVQYSDVPEYASGGRRGAELPGEDLLFALDVRVPYTWTVTGGTGAGTILGDAAYRVVQNVILKSDGESQVIVRPRSLRVLNKFWNQAEKFQQAPTSLAAGASQTSRETNFTIPLHMPFSYNPGAALLPAYLGRKPELIFEWSSPGDLATSEDGTLALSSVAPEVFARPVYGVRRDVNYGFLRMNWQEYDIAASASDRKFYIDWLQDGEELRAVLIEAEVADAYNDSVITAAKLVVNGDDWFDKATYAYWRNRNLEVYKLASRESGVILFDFAEDRVTERGEIPRVDTAYKPYVQLDLTKQAGTNTIRITTVSMIRGDL